MIHYSCDLCKRELNPSDDVRYVVRMQVTQEVEPQGADETDDDRDYLEEIQDMLARMGDTLDDISSLTGSEMRFDLCPECARKFAKNPLGRDLTTHLSFSQN